jgi:prophage regulatory protein
MRLIRLKEVMYCSGLARSTIYKYIADDMFPKPVSLGDRAVAWVEDEVQEWIEVKIEQRGGAVSVVAS